jgi:hypothetical protein
MSHERTSPAYDRGHNGLMSDLPQLRELVASGDPVWRIEDWHWTRFCERPSVVGGGKTEDYPEIEDHDHCLSCHEAAFSERYEGDLREGWAIRGPDWKPPAERVDAFYWLCPRCYEELAKITAEVRGKPSDEERDSGE